jgi:predicted Rossmann fold nucleotide-binding protein DprA/Smf involved in DNA uptake
MRIGVVGSRSFNDYELLKKYLDRLHSIKPIECIVSGGANGADTLGEQWAKDNGIKRDIYRPNWKKYGKKAGFLRNLSIISKSDAIVAFWDGISKGTKHTIDESRKQGKRVKIIYTDPIFLRKKKIDRIIKKIELKRKSLF